MVPEFSITVTKIQTSYGPASRIYQVCEHSKHEHEHEAEAVCLELERLGHDVWYEQAAEGSN